MSGSPEDLTDSPVGSDSQRQAHPIVNRHPEQGPGLCDPHQDNDYLRGEFTTTLELLPLNDIAAPCQMTTGGVRCIKCNKRHVNSSACLVVDRTIAIPHRSFFLGRVTKIDAVLVFIGSCLGNANNFLCVHKYNTDLEWICEACKFAAFWLL